MRQVLAFLFAISFTATAHADPLADLATAQKAVIEAWIKVPFSQQDVTFVTEPSTGYGVYKKRDSNVFKPGEPIFSYAEPIGYGWKQLPNNRYELHLVADLDIIDASGEVVWSKKGFLDSTLQSYKQNLEFKLDMTLNVNGAPAGKYKLHYKLYDMASGKTSSFDQDFEIASAG